MVIYVTRKLIMLLLVVDTCVNFVTLIIQKKKNDSKKEGIPSNLFEDFGMLFDSLQNFWYTLIIDCQR